MVLSLNVSINYATQINYDAPTHTAHVVRDALRDIEIEIMDWPPHSPDLNPIENFWASMKAEVYKIRPDLI
jgi:transposase